MDDGACDGDPLHFPARKDAGGPVRSRCQPDPIQCVSCGLVRGGRIMWHIPETKQNVFQGRPVRQQVKLLVHDADGFRAKAGLMLRRQGVDTDPVEQDVSRRGPVQQGAEMEECCFARSGRSRNDHIIAFPEIEIHLLQHVDRKARRATEGLAHALQGEDHGVRTRSPACSPSSTSTN